MTAHSDRKFFHSFPRPKQGETVKTRNKRALSILSLMKKTGLVLAPEVVNWNIDPTGGGSNQFKLLQRRASFTELSMQELDEHCKVFGPISLSFDITRLREIGITPVIYVPQKLDNSSLSQISTICARGIYYTREVMKQLDKIKNNSDPSWVSTHYKKPLAPDAVLKLNNPDEQGNLVASYDIPANHVHNLIQHIGFNNIPFDHSSGILNFFMNMFYPTDNTHTGEQLGYYSQREWRLIAGDINLNGRPIGRTLNKSEIEDLERVDSAFWTRSLEFDGKMNKRSDLALVYQPVPDWSFFDYVESVYVPEELLGQTQDIVKDKAVAYPIFTT